jgi:hypothetical protein
MALYPKTHLDCIYRNWEHFQFINDRNFEGVLGVGITNPLAVRPPFGTSFQATWQDSMEMGKAHRKTSRSTGQSKDTEKQTQMHSQGEWCNASRGHSCHERKKCRSVLQGTVLSLKATLQQRLHARGRKTLRQFGVNTLSRPSSGSDWLPDLFASPITPAIYNHNYYLLDRL